METLADVPCQQICISALCAGEGIHRKVLQMGTHSRITRGYVRGSLSLELPCRDYSIMTRKGAIRSCPGGGTTFSWPLGTKENPNYSSLMNKARWNQERNSCLFQSLSSTLNWQNLMLCQLANEKHLEPISIITEQKMKGRFGAKKQ